MKPGSSWPDARIARWEILRARGRSHFLWNYGVLRWGGFMFCFSLGAFQYSHFGSVFSSEGNWLFRVLFAAATWVFVGLLYGHSQWRRNEREYLEQPPRGEGRFTP